MIQKILQYFLKLNEEYFTNELELEYGTPSPNTLLRIYEYFCFLGKKYC